MRLFIIFLNGFWKTTERTEDTEKKQLSVLSASSVVDLLCHNPFARKRLKSHEAMKG